MGFGQGKVTWTEQQIQLATNAVSVALTTAGDQGTDLATLERAMRSALGTQHIPEGKKRGNVFFKARVKRIGNRYYLMGMGPEKEKKERRQKHRKGADSAKSSSETEMSYEGDLRVQVQGGGRTLLNTPAKKIRIIILSVIVLASAAFMYWH